MEVNTAQGNEPNAGAAPQEGTAPPAAPQVTDIDGISEFTFQGEKWNPEKLHQVTTEHKSWSEKIKEYEKELEFANNLQVDLDNVLGDPRLADRFKAIYPKKYHAILDRFLKSNGQAPAQAQTNNAQPSLPKEFINEFEQVKERLKFHEDRAYQAEVAAANAKLDSTLPPLFKKYEMANEEQVYARAESLLNRRIPLTDATWERLIRESHEAMQKKADQVYGAKLKTQLEKGEKGKDVGPGGATPGQAPVKPRTFDEAREAMLKHYSQAR